MKRRPNLPKGTPVRWVHWKDDSRRIDVWEQAARLEGLTLIAWLAKQADEAARVVGLEPDVGVP